MRTIAELTDQQFKQLLDEYFAEPKKRSKMTDEEIKDLAQRLNAKINVPIINEAGEEKILIKIVLKVDRFLYDHLPNEFYDLVRSSDQGIDDEEAKRLTKSLAKLANKKIDLPYLPEVLEYVAIRFIIGIIVNAARKQWNLSSSRIKAAQVEFPGTPDLDDQQVTAVVEQFGMVA